MQKASTPTPFLFGSVGGPKWDGVARDVRPENGLLRHSQAAGPFCQLAARDVFPSAGRSLEPQDRLGLGLDIMILRELTGGVYFGEPKEITDQADGSDGQSIRRFTHQEIERRRACGVRSGAQTR